MPRGAQNACICASWNEVALFYVAYTVSTRAERQRRSPMDEHIRKRPENWAITNQNTEERHQAIILSTIAKRAQQLFEERGCKHGFELDDWLAAEQELRRGEFAG